MSSAVSHLATHLDLHMIVPDNVKPCGVADAELPVVDDAELARRMGERKLLHFVSLSYLGSYRDGATRQIFVTRLLMPRMTSLRVKLDVTVPMIVFPRDQDIREAPRVTIIMGTDGIIPTLKRSSVAIPQYRVVSGWMNR